MHLKRSQVAITGIGAVTCAGPDVDHLWQAVLHQKQFVAPLDLQDGDQQFVGCRAGQPQVPGLPVGEFKRLHRFAQLGVAAGHEAWHDARLSAGDVDPRRIAIVAGTSRGPNSGHSSSPHADQPPMPARRIRPSAAVYSSASSLAGTLSDHLGARGPSLTVSATCASSAVALGVAALHIQAGQCDVALVGGADAPLHPTLLAEMEAAGVLGTGDDPQHICRPFDRRRTGIVVGEAAAFLVLEHADHAAIRGAHVRGWLTGWSATCDPGQRAGMSAAADGLREALELAMAAADCQPHDIDALHLHGTGTRLNDAAEARVIRQLFGRRGSTLPCTSTKPITGHCLGASGALQAVINVRALETQCLPPTANCEELDADCELDLIRDVPWQGRLNSILTHSAGFWGNHAGLLFHRA